MTGVSPNRDHVQRSQVWLFGEPRFRRRRIGMVTINNSKCTGCGLCARVCHEHCMEVGDASVVIDYAVRSESTRLNSSHT